jgi:hypothetical protein
MYSVLSTSVFFFQTQKELKETNLEKFPSNLLTGYLGYIPEAKRQGSQAIRSSPSRAEG